MHGALSSEEILAEVVERPRRAHLPMPGLEVIERPGWYQLVAPAFRHGNFNEVSFSRLDEAEADAVIDATIARYRELGCRFRWRVGPGSAPADLSERLARRGLARIVVYGMARSTETELGAGSGGRGADGGAGTGIEVVEVGPPDVDTYTRVMADGWNVDPAPLAAANALAAASASHDLFLARCDGEPAAVAASVTFERSTYLIGGVTLPRARRRGVYRALVAARLTRARSRGLVLATAHAMATTSAPILEHLGFETVCRFDVFTGEVELPERPGPAAAP